MDFGWTVRITIENTYQDAGTFSLYRDRFKKLNSHYSFASKLAVF